MTWPSSPPSRADERLDRPPGPSLVRVVARANRAEEVRRHVLALADLRQVVDVARERSSGEGAARPEVGAGADPPLGLQPSFDLGRVGADALRDAGELVRERDRQREEGVHAVLHELRRLDAHPLDPVGEGAEQLLDAVAVAVGPDPDDDPVRLRERRDRVAEPQVLGRVGERAPGSTRLLEEPRRPDREL